MGFQGFSGQRPAGRSPTGEHTTVRAARRGPPPNHHSLTPEVTLTRKQYPRMAVDHGGKIIWRGKKEGERAGSAGRRRGLTRGG